MMRKSLSPPWRKDYASEAFRLMRPAAVKKLFALLLDAAPQVVVLDVMMPGMGGLEVLQRVKSTYPNIEVILLTGIGSTKEGVEGMRLGAFDFLMKPLQIEELIEKIKAAIEKAAGGNA